jgi:uncharacterized protein (TIGR03437 family)
MILAVPSGGQEASTGGSRWRAPIGAAQIRRTFHSLPLVFEANRGQAAAAVRFIARGNGYTLNLTRSGDLLALIRSGAKGSSANDAGSETPLKMKVAGANRQPSSEGLEELPARVNYYIGADWRRWRSGIATYARVKYRAVYPGIDLVYYGKQGRLEYDFEIAPGARPETVALQFEGADELKLDERGRLAILLGGTTVHFDKPSAYQQAGETRRSIAASYEIKSGHRVGFRVGTYDTTRPLIIDPVLVYSTYLGGNYDDEGLAIAVDAAGSAVVTGTTASVDFPTTTTPYSFPTRSFDVFVAKFNPAGSGLVYATYIGGDRGTDLARSIALDASGSAYVTGETYLSGNYLDAGNGVAVDSSGHAYVTGATGSTDFPVTPGAFQASAPADFIQNSAFVTKLNASGSGLVYSTYLGGTFIEEGSAIAVDSAGNAYVTGQVSSGNFPTTPGALQRQGRGSSDGFVTKLNSAGSALVYSTLLGGGDSEWGKSIVVDGEGNAYVTGAAFSRDFPVTAGAFQTAHRGGSLFLDGYVAKLNAAGSALVYSTFLGGTGADEGYSVAVDSTGNAYIAGVTYSPDFPVTPDAFQPALGGPVVPTSGLGAGADSFIAKLNATGAALLFGSYLGGNTIDTRVGFRRGVAVAVDPAGNAYLGGTTLSPNFPTAAAYQRNSGGTWDAFVAKVGEAAALGPPAISSVVNAASFQPGLASGAWLTIFGTNLAAVTRAWRDSDFAGNSLPTQLDAVSVSVNGKPAYVYFISPGQLNVLGPADPTEGPVQVEVITPSGRSNPATVEKRSLAPAFFKLDAEGRRYLAAVHADGTLLGKPGLLGAATTRPAKPGDVILLYGTGFGPTTPPFPEGEIIRQPGILPGPITIRIGDVLANVSFAGLVGAGLYQFNVTVPALANGDHEVVAEINGFGSPSEGFITVQR